MKESAISLEKAGQELAEWARRAQTEQTTFVVLDGAGPVARLVPAEIQRCSGADLAQALAALELTVDEAQEWAKDLREARKHLSRPEDRWL